MIKRRTKTRFYLIVVSSVLGILTILGLGFWSTLQINSTSDVLSPQTWSWFKQWTQNKGKQKELKSAMKDQILDPHSLGSSQNEDSNQAQNVDSHSEDHLSPHFLNTFIQESDQMGHLDPHPEKTLERLKSWAHELSIAELSWLKKNAVSLNAHQDARMLSVFALSLASEDSSLSSEKSDFVLNALNDLAISPLPSSIANNERMNNFEMVLRYQAIDGIISHKGNQIKAKETLKTISNSTNVVSAIDRSLRGLHYLNYGGLSPKEQEEEAARKLLEESNYGK